VKGSYFLTFVEYLPAGKPSNIIVSAIITIILLMSTLLINYLAIALNAVEAFDTAYFHFNTPRMFE